MRCMLMLAASLALATTSNAATAQASRVGEPTYGNGLWDHCQAQSPNYDRGFCDGFILAAARASYDTNLKHPFFCIPAGVLNNQLFDIVRNGLHDHPEERHYGSNQLVITYLHRAFPCAK